jgi:glyoxylase-like metal-dependent hydrolase (beta-lactamase superfamily II)
VYFHEGDIAKAGHCNNGWIIFEDYVLVIDGNFPSGAEEIIPKIRAQTSKPIRFAFDTHHHGDHAYGNATWVREGAVPVAHTGVIEEMKKYETGYYGGKPGRWEDTAKGRKDVANSKLKPPTVLFPKEMIFDDGKHRVELHHFGVAHTHGDGFAWLPKEKILFTGDACVNGAYNYTADGNITQWIQTLEKAKQLGAERVCPGHGPMSSGALLEEQQRYFKRLQTEVKKFGTKKDSGAKLQAALPKLKEDISKDQQIGKYIGGSFEAQMEQLFVELGGKPFLPKQAAKKEHDDHAHSHGAVVSKR